MDSLATLIQQLELKLLHSDFRTDPSLIDEILSETFEEIGSDGQPNSRHAVVEWLMQKDNNQSWTLVDFRIKPLSDHTVIAIYQAVKNATESQNPSSPDGLSGSIRSSVWQRQNGRWKMVFHQATKQR